MQDHDFLFDAPAFEITKTYRDDNGQMFIEGVASTVDIDLTRERMSPEAIAKMAARAIGIPLRSEHGKGWDDRLGEIVQADVVKDDTGSPALWIKARLFDWSSKARDLFELLKSGSKLGLSVAGKIHPGGIVKELSQSLGKYIPTYKDVDLTEISVTDHPANLGTFCVAVAKSLGDQEVEEVSDMQKDVTNANQSKPKEYADVPSSDFLDPENYKYPADKAHLMPALKYFNHEGQRSKGGYSTGKWAEMGHKLAAKLKAETGDSYHYDESQEKVVQDETKKTDVGKEVSTMTNSNLVSKQVPGDVANFAKEWGRDLNKELSVEKASSTDSSTGTPSTETPSTGSTSTTSTDKAGTFPPASSTSTDSSTSTPSTTSTDKDMSVTTTSSDPDSSSTSTASSIESLLSEIASTLSSLSSGSASSSDSSTSDSSTSTPSTSTPSSDTSSGSTDSSSELELALTNAKKAFDTLAGIVAKGKSSTTTSGGKPSMTMTMTPSTQSSDTSTSTSKALQDLAEAVKKLAENQAELKKSIEDQPKARKGFALALEKRFDGHSDVQKSVDHDMLDTLKKDPEVDFNAIHRYKTTGELPVKYQN